MKSKNITFDDLHAWEAAMQNIIAFRCDKDLRHDFWLRFNGELWHLYVGAGRISMREMGTLIQGFWTSTVSDWVLACICKMSEIDHGL